MSTTNVSRLKASLSSFLRRVKAGEEVLVTERGRPVARLMPVREGNLPAHLAEMEKQGWVRAGRAPLSKTFWNLPRPKDPRGTALRALLDEREESP